MELTVDAKQHRERRKKDENLRREVSFFPEHPGNEEFS
jgi:hypothetical protein